MGYPRREGRLRTKRTNNGKSEIQDLSTAFASVEMTFVWWVRRTGNGKNDGKDEMRGFFAALRMTT